MTNLELAQKAIDAAKNYKTLYILGCFGAPMNASNKKRYTSNYDYNKKKDRTAMINAASADTFGFDCVCFIKGLLWGWCGDASKVYGGATYKSNGVPDIGANQIIGVCSDISTDFSSIEVGELCWMDGHVGLYVGDGLSVECTPKWTNDVQFTACNRSIAGYNKRTWTKHGKLPYVTYVTEEKPKEYATMTDEEMYKFFKGQGLNDYGVAGLLGNFYAESGLRANNLQNTYEKKLGMSDDAYTKAVDDGTYDNFVKDSAGYGLAQWTYWSRKEALLKFAKQKNASIGNARMQCEYAMKELTGSYPSVLKVLKAAKSVREASDAVLIKYEIPADRGESVQVKRAGYGQKYYDMYADKTEEYQLYTVKKGDCLWAIARTFLGSGSRYPEIMKLNGLKSDLIHPGDVFKIPKK